MTTRNSLFDTYDILITKRDGAYWAIVKELNLVAAGPSIDEACEELAKKYASLQTDLRKAGFNSELPISSEKKRNEKKHSWRLRTAVMSAVTVLFFAVCWITFNAAIERVEVAAYRISKTVSVRPLLVKLRQEMLNLADAPEDRKKEIVLEVRQFVEATKPIMTELHPLFSDSCAYSATNARTDLATKP